MRTEGYIPANFVPVPGDDVRYTCKSVLFEDDQGRRFWISDQFLRMVRFLGVPGRSYGECTPYYMPANHPIKYIERGRYRESMKETKRTLKQRLKVTQFPSLRHRREFETALAAGKVRSGKENEYRYVTIADNGRRMLNRISLGGIFTRENY